MQHTKRGFLLVALLGLSECTATQVPPRVAAPAPYTMAVRLHDHLSFGVRLDGVSLLLDGTTAYETTSTNAPPDPIALRIAPGAHTLTVVVRASEPCGLFDQPRMTVTVRTLEPFVLGEGPATLDVDLYAGAATSELAQLVSIHVAGKRIALGANAEGESAPMLARCETGDELCALNVSIARASVGGNTRRISCYAAHRDEMLRWKEMLEDSFAAVSREGVTTSEAESAQLRARYAESRLRALAADARSCDARAASPRIERKVETVCPAPDVTASREGW